MTPEHKALMDALTRKAETDGLLSVEDIRSVAESLSAQSAQPQAGEPTGYIDRHRQKFASIEKHDAATLAKSGWTPVYLASPQPANPAQVVKKGSTITFGPNGVTIDPPGAETDDLLDQIAAIRDEYVAKRSEALDQMELNAQQGNTSDASMYSSEAERHGAAILAASRILALAESLTTAIGAGGQTVAEAHKLLLWAADGFDVHAKCTKVCDEIEGYEESAKMYRECASRLSSLFSLSQPYPADERVVEAPKRLVLDEIHIRLLRRGATSKWIGLSDNAGIHTGEVVALGELRRAGLVQPTKDDLPPGPPSMRPYEITDAGRAVLAGKE